MRSKVSGLTEIVMDGKCTETKSHTLVDNFRVKERPKAASDYLKNTAQRTETNGSGKLITAGLHLITSRYGGSVSDSR